MHREVKRKDTQKALSGYLCAFLLCETLRDGVPSRFTSPLRPPTNLGSDLGLRTPLYAQAIAPIFTVQGNQNILRNLGQNFRQQQQVVDANELEYTTQNNNCD